MRKHVAILRKRILVMSLVVGTILWVLGVTALVGLVAWALDRSTARQERKESRSAKNNA